MSAEGGRTGGTRLSSVETAIFFFFFLVLARIMYVECGGNRGPTRGSIYIRMVAPVAYQVILEPGIGQFREFESPRVHTRINSWVLFFVHKLTCGKRESVS